MSTRTETQVDDVLNELQRTADEIRVNVRSDAVLVCAAARLGGAVRRRDAPRLASRSQTTDRRGAMWRGRRVFGDGKTWRGVIIAVVGSIAAVAIQKHVVGEHVGSIAVVDYARVNVIALGAAMGGGAMLGELPNSFVKRRLGIARGATATGPTSVFFYVWDQVDLLTTTWPLLLPWVRPSALVVVASFLVAMAMHPFIALVGYLVGARRTAR